MPDSLHSSTNEIPRSRRPRLMRFEYMSRPDQCTLLGLVRGSTDTGSSGGAASARTKTASMTGHVNSLFGESSRRRTLIDISRTLPDATRSALRESLSSPRSNDTMRRHTKSSMRASFPFGETSAAVSAIISTPTGNERRISPLRLGSEYESWLVPRA